MTVLFWLKLNVIRLLPQNFHRIPDTDNPPTAWNQVLPEIYAAFGPPPVTAQGAQRFFIGMFDTGIRINGGKHTT